MFSILAERMRSAAKAAPLAATASGQTGPELSAREASSSPAASNAGLTYLLLFMLFLDSLFLPQTTALMLASASDKNAARRPLLGGGHTGGTRFRGVGGR
jgi:preprotein translocase subunit SecD